MLVHVTATYFFPADRVIVASPETSMADAAESELIEVKEGQALAAAVSRPLTRWASDRRLV